MPSMRPQSTTPATKRARRGPVPGEVGPDGLPTLAGGFHESSYELRTGMDMMETEWPEDMSWPGAPDAPGVPPR